ncbi:PREDICTED: complement factor H-like [Branchiostoma belcheri]|uniref:Complement factor H-like n=1 Tax=Branchiostoma belcheri TaxID=7741 RepID=A0A6P4ZPK3_BRABE|nr:PREDICTED: complement factor H-like [Branchiostoma belcheri]
MGFLYGVFLLELLLICAVFQDSDAAGCATVPPSPPNTHRTGCTAPYSDGEKCKYVCIAGYSEVSGDKKLVCRGGVWVGDPLVCKENCDPPMDPDNTIRKGCGDPYKHGEVCKYKCKGGYARAEGDHILTCDNGVWIGNPLVCEKNCGKPPSPPGTKREDCTYPIEHDEVCTYECKDGYTEVGGDDRLTCDSGVWFGAPLVCKAGCGVSPPSPHNTLRTDCTAPYRDGEKCKYECADGYTEVSGDSKLICKDQVWVGDPLVCQKNCDPPVSPDHTERKGCGDPYKHGEVCTYKCQKGFAEGGGDRELTCDNGVWVGVPLVCRENCEKPPTPPGSNRKDCSNPYGHDEVCTYECKDGYTEVGGDDSLTCHNGVWVGDPLVCKENCKKAPTPDDTVRTGCDAPYTHGEMCNYQCETGYRKTGGNDSLTCNDGDWDGEELVCVKPDCVVFPPNPPNTRRAACRAPYRSGEKCRYTCLRGYTEVSGDKWLTCNNEVWAGNPLVCKENCNPPPRPSNTDREGCKSPYKHGEVCNYRCDAGYMKTGGDDSLTCNDGAWDGSSLVCTEKTATPTPTTAQQPMDCGPPPMPANTIRTGCDDPYTQGEVCDYLCEIGYLKTGGDDSLTCNEGVWEGNQLVCEDHCPRPPNVPNTILSDCVHPFVQNEICIYECKPEYTEDGGDNLKTCYNRTWIGDDLDCKEDCGPPPNVDNTDRNGCFAPYNHDEECTYTCKPGFTPDGGGDTVTCDDGVWDWNRLPHMECKKNCNPPPVLANAIRGGCVAPYKHGVVCTYTCIAGFNPDGGGNMVTCDDGVWDWNRLPPMECNEVDCGPPPMLDYAILDGCVAPYKHGDKCNYHCFPEFCPDPNGGTGDMVTCDNGIWWIVIHHQC